jgi:hypothetical protein
MNVHKINTVVTENGTLTLHDLPFRAGVAVEVIVLEQSQEPRSATVKLSEINQYSLRGSVLRYDDPFEPAVSPEEWEALK